MKKLGQTRGVIPAQAGIQFCLDTEFAAWNWIPAFAGMTPGWWGARRKSRPFSARKVRRAGGSRVLDRRRDMLPHGCRD